MAVVNHDHEATSNGSGLEEKPLGTLLGDAVSQMGTLVRQEIELAKVEMKEELTKAGKAAGMGAAAAAAGHMALLFASLALAWLLTQFVNRASAFLVVGILYGIVAAVLAAGARTRARTIDPIPEQTVDTLKEDVQWAKALKN